MSAYVASAAASSAAVASAASAAASGRRATTKKHRLQHYWWDRHLANEHHMDSPREHTHNRMHVFVAARRGAAKICTVLFGELNASGRLSRLCIAPCRLWIVYWKKCRRGHIAMPRDRMAMQGNMHMYNMAEYIYIYIYIYVYICTLDHICSRICARMTHPSEFAWPRSVSIRAQVSVSGFNGRCECNERQPGATTLAALNQITS